MGMRITIYARALASALTAAATFAASAYVVIGGEGYPWTYAEQSDGTIVLGGNGNRAAASDITAYVEIPSSIKGKTVTAIGKYAFRDCRSIKSVTIPASVKKIEEGAFFSCRHREQYHHSCLHSVSPHLFVKHIHIRRDKNMACLVYRFNMPKGGGGMGSTACVKDQAMVSR